MTIYKGQNFEKAYKEIERLLSENEINFIGNCLTPFHLNGLESILLSHPDISEGDQGILLISDHSESGKTLNESHLEHISLRYHVHCVMMESHTSYSSSDSAFVNSMASKLVDPKTIGSPGRRKIHMINPRHPYYHIFPFFFYNTSLWEKYDPKFVVFEDGFATNVITDKVVLAVSENKSKHSWKNKSVNHTLLAFSDYLYPLFSHAQTALSTPFDQTPYDVLNIVTLGNDGLVAQTNLFKNYREVIHSKSLKHKLVTPNSNKSSVIFLFYLFDELITIKQQRMITAAQRTIEILGVEKYAYFGKHHPRSKDTRAGDDQLKQVSFIDPHIPAEEIFVQLDPEYVIDFGSSAVVGAKAFCPESTIIEMEVLTDNITAEWHSELYHNTIDRWVNTKNPALISPTIFSRPEEIEVLPLVSIILYGNRTSDELSKTLSAISKNTKYPQYEIFLLSRDHEPELGYHKGLNIQHIKVDDPETPLSNIQKLQTVPKGLYLTFINTGSCPGPFWLYGMVNTIQNNTSVSAVGAKIIDSNRLVQHLWFGIDSPNASVESIGYALPFKAEGINDYLEISAHSINGLLIRADIISESLNLTQLPPGPALCQAIWEAGNRVIYCPDSNLIDYRKSIPYSTEAALLSNSNLKHFEALELLQNKLKKLIPKHFAIIMGMPGPAISKLTTLLYNDGYYCGQSSQPDAKGTISENLSIAGVNEALMSQKNNDSTDSQLEADYASTNSGCELQEMLVEYLGNEKVCLADARFSFTYPAWSELLFETTKIIYVKTDQAEFVENLQKQFNLSASESTKLWNGYNDHCTSYGHDHPLIQVNQKEFDEMDEAALLSRIKYFMNENISGKSSPESTDSRHSELNTTADTAYTEKMNQEIAIYEHNTEVHNLPEIHNVYAREFLVPSLKGLTGVDDWMEWWIQEIDAFVERSGRTLTLLSLACGNGDTEIGMLKRLASPEKVHLIGVDVNPSMIERARAAAKDEGLSNVSFEIQDLNKPTLKAPIDVVLANHSLHHLVELETLFSQLAEISSADMIFLINDMIGRNGHVMWPNAHTVVEEIWRRLDQRFRLNNFSKRYDLQPFNRDCSLDGFEGIRAQDILPALIKTFDVELFLPFATIINRFVDRGYGHNFKVKDEQDRKLILKILDLDITLLKEKKLSPTQAFIKVQKKGTVKDPRYLFQTPEEALASRSFSLRLEDYYPRVQAFLPALPNPDALDQIEREKDIPMVSIVIPVFNNVEYTHKCVKSILKNTRHPNYEAIIVDNASTDGTAQYLENLKNDHFKIISHNENLGFVGGCNSGAAQASGEYILFLNNDTEVKPNWMRAIVDLMKARPDCGAVGSKLIYADGILQEAGGIIFSNGDGWNVGRGMDPRDPRFNYVREVDYCSGASLAIKTDLWNQIGGFDTLYSPAYYEDTDLCFAVRKFGYKVLYHPLSEVIHYEGKTAGIDLTSGFKKYQQINRKKFEKKWDWELQSQFKHSPENVINAAERGNKANILIADPLLPVWDRASGSLRLFQTIEILASGNYHVVFIARMSSPQDVRYIKRLIDLGVEVYPQDVGALKDISDDPALDKMKPIDYEVLFKEKNFKYAILSFWNIAAYYMPIIRRLSPETQIVVDTVDVHFIRELREAELNGDSQALAEAKLRKPLELETYKGADSLWVVTNEDLKGLEKAGIDKPIHILPNIHKSVPFIKQYKDTQDLLFVGNFSHTPNRDAILYFCEAVFPLIKKKLPEVKLYIVGNNPPLNIFELASEDIIVTGFVEDISPYLFQARVSVNPLRYGAGMKGKIGEALSWGLPVVTSSIGAEGMNLEDGNHCLLANDAQGFATRVIELYNDPQLWQSLSEQGRNLVELNWSPAASKKILDEVIHVDTPEFTPVVSIVVLTWNALKFTRECVESIEAHTTYSYEIVFVDNASTDGSIEYLQDLVEQNDHYKLISNSENKGFAAGNNQGIKAATGKYVLLLNNDVLVSDRWLSKLVQALEIDENIGMVGPITNHISGRQMLTEVPYSDEPGFQQFAQQVLIQNTGKMTPRRRIAGFAVLMQKSLYEEVGGLDEGFGSGNFEDDDLCLKVRAKGKAIIVHEAVFIHHYGSQTFKANKLDYSESISSKGEVFKSKWPQVDYDELIELKNPLSETHPNMYLNGMNELEIGNYESAYLIMSQLVLENPLYEDALAGLAMSARGSQKDAEAKSALSRILKLNPNHAVAYNLSGLIAGESANLEAAKLMFKRAVEIDPNFIDARRNYAETLLLSDAFQEGVQELLDILEQFPDDIPTILRMADLNLEADRVADAITLVKKVLEIDPNHVQANHIMEKLEN